MRVRNGPHRALLSETLPFEVPLAFTNAGLYHFIATYGIVDGGSLLTCKRQKPGIELIVRLLFGHDILSEGDLGKGAPLVFKRSKGLPVDTIPYSYRIRRQDAQSRALNVPHPRNQLAIASFYGKYQDLILYYHSLSPFSVRAAQKRVRYVNQEATPTGEDHVQSGPFENILQDYQPAANYFLYGRYKGIHELFESEEFYALEKKHGRLLRLDVASCFDSIYTHSVAWATFGKAHVKENLEESKATFAGRFDKLMQRMNYNETHGILIGPEVSRVFAETVFQAIDRAVLKALEAHGLVHHHDYEILRYLDDYFVFFGRDQDKHLYISTIKRQLGEYKLSLNQAKEEYFPATPIITGISVAKSALSHLVSTLFSQPMAADSGRHARSDHSRLIQSYKEALVGAAVESRSVIGYLLAALESQVLTMTESAPPGPAIVSSDLSEHRLRRFVEVVDLAFFAYSGGAGAASAIKLARLMALIARYSRAGGLTTWDSEIILRHVDLEIDLQLSRHADEPDTEIEKLYLLACKKELRQAGTVDSEKLKSYFGSLADRRADIDYFVATGLLHFVGPDPAYREIPRMVVGLVLAKFTAHASVVHKDSESLLLLLDLITCPTVLPAEKRALLAHFDIYGEKDVTRVVNFQSRWFTDWEMNDTLAVLNAKRHFEVY